MLLPGAVILFTLLLESGSINVAKLSAVYPGKSGIDILFRNDGLRFGLDGSVRRGGTTMATMSLRTAT